MSCLSFNPPETKIHIEGIKNTDEEDIINANKLGYKINTGFSSIGANKNIARYAPTLVKKDPI